MKTKEILKEWNSYLNKKKIDESPEMDVDPYGHLASDYRNIGFVKDTCEAILDASGIDYDRNTFDYAVETDKSFNGKEKYTAYIDFMEELRDAQKEMGDTEKFAQFEREKLRDNKELVEFGKTISGVNVITYDAKFVLDIEGRLYVKMQNGDLMEMSEDLIPFKFDSEA